MFAHIYTRPLRGLQLNRQPGLWNHRESSQPQGRAPLCGCGKGSCSQLLSATPLLPVTVPINLPAQSLVPVLPASPQTSKLGSSDERFQQGRSILSSGHGSAQPAAGGTGWDGDGHGDQPLPSAAGSVSQSLEVALHLVSSNVLQHAPAGYH